MAGEWDSAAVAHLEQVSALYGDAGVIDYIRDVVGTTWRANRARWSPDTHYDDTNTLGYQTSRNVNNRISATAVLDDAVSPSVLTEADSGIAVLALDGFRLRVVKAPIESALDPDFDRDFDWSASAIRDSAARRNSAHYYPFDQLEWTLSYEEDVRPRQRRRPDQCKEVFLIWAGDTNTDRTAGWLGLPKIGDLPWMAVVELWRDTEEDDHPDQEAGRAVREDDD